MDRLVKYFSPYRKDSLVCKDRLTTPFGCSEQANSPLTLSTCSG